MAGENPEDTRTGAPDEFLSKGKWQRFQVLVMGPVMNLRARRRRDGGRALPGRARAGVRDASRWSSARSPRTRSAAKAGLKPGDRIVDRRRQAGRELGQFSMAIVPQGEAPGDARLSCATASRGQLIVVPDGQGKYELGDIGIQPADPPADRRCQSRRSRPPRPGSSRRRHPRRRRPARTSRTTRLDRADQGERGQAADARRSSAATPCRP